jgi:hypothetical protein
LVFECDAVKDAGVEREGGDGKSEERERPRGFHVGDDGGGVQCVEGKKNGAADGRRCTQITEVNPLAETRRMNTVAVYWKRLSLRFPLQ